MEKQGENWNRDLQSTYAKMRAEEMRSMFNPISLLAHAVAFEYGEFRVEKRGESWVIIATSTGQLWSHEGEGKWVDEGHVVNTHVNLFLAIDRVAVLHGMALAAEKKG